MNFDLTDDRRMLADTLDRYLSRQYGFENRDRIASSPRGYSEEQWRQFAELGAIGALFSESDGGFGGAAFDITVVFEALGRGLVLEPFLGCAVLSSSALAHAGNASQKALIADIVSGHKLLAFAHSEPAARYEPTRVQTQASRHGDAGWLLNGAKALVQQGEHADMFLVSARSSGAKDDSDGISLFLVPAGTPGLTLHGYPLIDGGRAAEMTLNDVVLPAAALVGKAGVAGETLEFAIGRGILALCAEALGAMEVAKQATLEYLQTRRQFGVPIGSFQALQHRMADLLLEIEQARSAVINAAAALEKARQPRERALAAAKYTIGRVGTLVAEECIQLHGGIGMTWELPLAHYAKRLIMIDHQLGDEDHHLLRYIALGRDCVHE